MSTSNWQLLISILTAAIIDGDITYDSYHRIHRFIDGFYSICSVADISSSSLDVSKVVSSNSYKQQLSPSQQYILYGQLILARQHIAHKQGAIAALIISTEELDKLLAA